MKKSSKKKFGYRIALMWLFVAAALMFSGNRPAKAAYSKPYLIKVNKQACVVTVYEKDNKGNYTVPVRAMLCSPGAATPLGTFYTPAKYRWHVLDGNVWGQYCTRIHGGVLFHSVWYYERDPSTLSVIQYNKLGTQCSHGCVRLNVEDAKWIYDNCSLGTRVVVYNSSNPGPLGKPKALKITSGKSRDYDPTDRWSPGNPYIKTQPKITGAASQKLNYGDSVDVTKGVKAVSSTGGNITSSISVSIKYDGKKVKKINTKKAGIYYVTYYVKDSAGKSASQTVKFTVVDNVKPTLSGTKNMYTNIPDNINKGYAMLGVKAKWHGKDVTEDVKVTIKKIASESGLKTYLVQYEITASNGKSASKNRTLYLDTKLPAIKGAKNQDITMDQTDEDMILSLAKKGLTVSDNLTKMKKSDITIKVKQQSELVYEVTYSVKDRAGNRAVKTVNYVVIDPYRFQGVEDTEVSADTEITEELVKQKVQIFCGSADVTREVPISVSISEPTSIDENGTLQYVVVYTIEVTVTNSKGKEISQNLQATAVFTKKAAAAENPDGSGETGTPGQPTDGTTPTPAPTAAPDGNNGGAI